MSEITIPYIGTHISIGWQDRIVLSHEDTQALVKLLNKATIYRESYSEKGQILPWGDADSGENPRVTFSQVSEVALAEARMNKLIDP